ncbi:DUF4176 domain-containing protein [Bombilactobacillus thymidiniphilus]|uniref:DUF4176 domain-containing protein n=1 Tax=Bombilactobacillus thymidiniphilus TaxID=2923363 RepID=A0ABY4PB59_9LACO|nr:DUF4176 domain-containing protein [Bombilactobacillus thymidiniphilus]UQS82984.1 DUF4176 domain-containing protein [Bombilactobacillus thymidiniphilus]UQS83186.1 DUF4176 domain-containing protein [Bombilactobacillus thymidiniphilus]
MQDKILPIGSIVTLKNGNGTPVMIINRAALYETEEQTGYFDYSSVIYPAGLQDSNELCFFNHEDIAELIFLGYRDDEELEFADNYEDLVQASGYDKLSVDD